MRELKNTCRAAIVQATPVMFDKARSLGKALRLIGLIGFYQFLVKAFQLCSRHLRHFFHVFLLPGSCFPISFLYLYF